MNTIIECKGVDMWYDRGKPNEVHVLKDINLTIERGDYAAFFGPSGCGKTTILYAISGIDRYQDGKVFINGKDITGLSNKELAIFRQTGIGIVFQQFNLVPSLTILQNVALPMAFIGIAREPAEVEARRLLDRLNIGHLATRFPSELSGGQQQRVGIARALANNPPIIIADEPLGNLDSENAKNVLEFLKELNEKDKRTIIMVTHEAWSLRDVRTTFYMKDGAITNTEHKVVQAPPIKTAFPSTTPAAEKAKLPLRPPPVAARGISNLLMRNYSMDETRRFERFLTERMTWKIDAAAFRDAIDRPYRKGGVGLWKRTADRVAAYVESALTMSHDLHAIQILLGQQADASIAAEVAHVRRWLLEDVGVSLTATQVAALDNAIADRVRQFSTAAEFKEVLSRTKNDFGVGLSFRSAERVAEKLASVFEPTPQPTHAGA